jgi:RNA polymerase sigma-70 factor (ECF subfamily)
MTATARRDRLLTPIDTPASKALEATAISAPSDVSVPHDPRPTSATTPWAELMRDHAGRVYRHAYRLTGNRHEAEDLTQDVFIRVFGGLPRSNPSADSFAPWLYRITYNLFIDRVRHRRLLQFVELPGDIHVPATDKNDPARIMDDRVFDDDVQAALGGLSPHCLEAILLHDVDGWTYAEIAECFGVTRGTVASRMHRGHTMLRDALAHRAPRPARGTVA